MLGAINKSFPPITIEPSLCEELLVNINLNSSRDTPNVGREVTANIFWKRFLGNNLFVIRCVDRMLEENANIIQYHSSSRLKYPICLFE